MSRDLDVTALHYCEDCGHATRDGRAYHGAPCPFCEGQLARYIKAGPEATIVPTEAARTARFELAALIKRTGGGSGFELDQHGEQSATPLALVRWALERRRDDADDDAERDAYAGALRVVEAVGEETGEETSLTDPLTDSTFEALRAFNRALGHVEDDEPADPPDA